MSTSIVQPNSEPNWKQEVNLRLAEHKNRKGLPAAQPAEQAHGDSASSRGAQIAARVAARYAQTPSFSQQQAAEAQAALRAARIATEAALEANTAAQAALDSLQAASAGPRLWTPEDQQAESTARPSAPEWEPESAPVLPIFPSSLPASLDDWEIANSQILREPDLSQRPVESTDDRALRLAEREESWQGEAIEPVEPYLPIYANLIEFPRELVATRKMRPRRVEGAFALAGSESQLSIFEVDPDAISNQPEAAGAAPDTAWPEPEWCGIELEALPMDEPEASDARALLPEVDLAPIARRMMATLVDGALIASAFLVSALIAAIHIGHLPAVNVAHLAPAKIVAIGAISAFLLASLLYYALFLTLAEATPGMRCARISLCTFDNRVPTRAQLRSRLGALLLSLIPVGLGVVWALFDDDHLCWHDRLSRTYLRNC